jgi:hypothetical protein
MMERSIRQQLLKEHVKKQQKIIVVLDMIYRLPLIVSLSSFKLKFLRLFMEMKWLKLDEVF